MAKMNRRNVLLGLGTAAAGSGIVFGSGAFTQVQADRDLAVTVSDDASAVLGINADGSNGAVDESEFVSEGSDGVAFEINLDNDFGDLNPDSFFRFDGNFDFINNADGSGDSPIEIGLAELGPDGQVLDTEPNLVKFVNPNVGLGDGDITTDDEGSDVTPDVQLDSGTNLSLDDDETVTTNLIIDSGADADSVDQVRFTLENNPTDITEDQSV